jgi:hypothetical protein
LISKRLSSYGKKKIIKERERGQERLEMAVNLKKKMMLGWPSMCGRI